MYREDIFLNVVFIIFVLFFLEEKEIENIIKNTFFKLMNLYRKILDLFLLEFLFKS